MTPMEINRRQLLLSSGATMLSSAPIVSDCLSNDISWYASAQRDARNRHHAVVFGIQGNKIYSVQLPGRGHATTVRPGTVECVTFARRPGNFAVVFDARGGKDVTVLSTPRNRHFFGHGKFSPDGRLLYATENDFEMGRGILSVRDATDNYNRIGEFFTGGIGPHDVSLLPDKKTLVIANGGVETHPDFPGKAMNIATMSPSLTYLNSATGEILETVRLDQKYHQISIRHLDVAKNGTVIFGCQNRGSKKEHHPLIGFHKMGEKPKFAIGSNSNFRDLRGYVGSVAINHLDGIVAATSSPGNKVLFFDIATRKHIGSRTLHEVGGISRLKGKSGFIASTAKGSIHSIRGVRTGLIEKLTSEQSSRSWDNHLTIIEL